MYRIFAFIISLLAILSPARGQIVTDSSPYFGAVIHYPSELNAKINTPVSGFAAFERIYQNHMEEISLCVNMFIDRSGEDVDISSEYYSDIRRLAETASDITYSTVNKDKKWYVIS